MGAVCTKKRRSEDILGNKRNTSRRTRMSDQAPGSANDDELIDRNERKRGSRLSQTRNSVIMAKRNIDSYIEHHSVRHISQSRVLYPQPPDSQEMSIESVGRGQVYTMPKNSNVLSQVARACVISLQKPRRSLIRQTQSPTHQRSHHHLVLHSQQHIHIPIQTLQQSKDMSSLLVTELISIQRQDQEAVQRRDIDTLYYLIERVQMSILNLHGMIWLLKKHLKEDGIDLVYALEQQVFGNDRFEFTRMHLLSTNLQHHYWDLTFEPNRNYATIFGAAQQRKHFLEDIEHVLQVDLLWMRAILSDTGTLQLNCYTPRMNDPMAFQRTKSIDLKDFNCIIEQRPIVNCITLSCDQFDVWGNREYKTVQEEQGEGIFHYIRPVGWKYG